MPLPEGACISAYKSFRACNSHTFQIIYGSKHVLDSSVLLILDSSFNPPHWGHYTLIKKGLQYHTGKSSHVLLMLSVNNADKAPQPASFDKRMEMMCLMADMLKEERISSSVGITTFGKYVDKYKVIRKSYFPKGTMSFLVGFDTITRIFDPKYYVPHLPSQALNDFMKSSEFCCLTRAGEEEHNKQVNYADHISQGFYEPSIPRSWGSRIHVLVNDKKYECVSSSSIRKDILNSRSLNLLTGELPPAIIKYIQNHGNSIFQ